MRGGSRRKASNYPPAKPEALRWLAPQRGLTATVGKRPLTRPRPSATLSPREREKVIARDGALNTALALSPREREKVIARDGALNTALALSPREREKVIARGGALNIALAFSPREREKVIARGGALNIALAFSPREREKVIARGGALNTALALSQGRGWTAPRVLSIGRGKGAPRSAGRGGEGSFPAPPTATPGDANLLLPPRQSRGISQRISVSSSISRWARGIALFFPFVILLLLAVTPCAGFSGGVAGTVKDASHAVVPGATVTATNAATGIQRQVVTNGQGVYSFPDLLIGRYNLMVRRTGFKPYLRTGVAIDADSSVMVDVVLEIGGQAQAVTVSEAAVHVDTSDTQMGEVIGGAKMAATPLNGRSYTDLLALQPGVVPVTSLTSNTQQDVGVSALSPSGGLNPGTISVDGQREFSNAFIVNGSDAEEDVNAGAAIIPNLDSIAEFRILTGNFDAEYGGYSGGQINVVTKSGANEFHGDMFEFLRNTDLDGRNSFSPPAAHLTKTNSAEPSAGRCEGTRHSSSPITGGSG